MTDPVVLQRPRARIDLAMHYAFLGERDPDAAERFLASAENTLRLLARNPGIGEPYPNRSPRLAGLRCSRIKRFRKHLIFYRPVPEGIEVIRVLHGSRDAIALLEDNEEG